MIEWINSVEDPSAFASKSQLAPNYSSLHHNVEMEQLNLSDAINLHPEITVNTSCQRMETVDQEKGTAEQYKKNCAGAAISSSFEQQDRQESLFSEIILENEI